MIYSAKELAGQLFKGLKLDPRSHFYVAFSGGIDSTVLLHLMTQLRNHYGFKLTALHANHQLQASSDQWAVHCQQVCEKLEVPLVKTSLSLNSASEATARDARYQWFKDVIECGSVLLTGHHRQDRAETFLFNLMRGAGSTGLSSMRAQRPFHGSKLVRPLLNLSDQQIDDYAKAHSLTWVEDPSNQSMRYSRNEIRHTILPALTKFRSDAVQNISRAAANLEQENNLLREIAISDLVEVREYPKHGLDQSHALCVADIAHLSRARQTNLLRFWLLSLHLHVPSCWLMEELLSAVSKPPASTAVLQEKGVQFRFYRGFMYVMPAQEKMQSFNPINWQNVEQPVELVQQKIRVDATRKLRDLMGAQSNAALRLTSRSRVVNPKALQGHSLSLKNWFQEIGVPPWRRQALPLLTMAQSGSEVVLGPVDQQLQSDWVLFESSLS